MSQRRKLGLLGLGGALALALVIGSHGRKADAAARAVGNVTYLKGKAERKPRGSGSWISLSQGSSVREGDRLRTKDSSRIEAKLHDGSMLRLGSSSELGLDQVRVSKKRKSKKKVKAKLFLGRIWASVTSLFGDDDSEFEVSTDTAVAGVRGTRFNAARADDGSTTVKVYSGEVLVSNRPIYAKEGHTKSKRVEVPGPQEVSKKQWDELVAGAMKMVQVSAAGEVGQPQDFKMADAGDDDWEAWNAERDKMAGIHQ